jgi:hypothetical protein
MTIPTKTEVAPWLNPEAEARKKELREILTQGADPDATAAGRQAAQAAIDELGGLQKEFPHPISITIPKGGGMKLRYEKGIGPRQTVWK